MAGETILVVDDAPVNLKLAAAVLRGDGYRVHLSSNAEQAITTLRTLRTDMLLVDLYLPGMNGLELTRRLREDARTRDTIVVALTGESEEEQHAVEAGCNGWISKPIDSRTLSGRVRWFLDGQPAAAAATPGNPAIPARMPGGLTLSGPEMESLRRGFLSDAGRHAAKMLEDLRTTLDADAASRLLHQWVGAAGALGFMEIAAEAQKAEALLRTPSWTKSDLRVVLSNLALLLSSSTEAADTVIPASIVDQLARKRIALVGFADSEADKVCAAFEKVRAMPYLFDMDEPGDSEGVRACAAVMLHVRPETMSSPWLQPDFTASPGHPWLFLGGREDLLALDSKVQARAVEFLIDGWQPEEVVMRLSFAMSRIETPAAVAPSPQTAAGTPEVVIADDDIHVQAVVRGALQSLGIECRSASSGSQALSLIREGRARAAVLDVNMPGMDGFEVLAALRHEKLPVRVVMLTARQHERDVLRGFELGADDYVAKPFNPLELVARLRRLL